MLLEQVIKEYLFELEIRCYTWKTIRSYRNNLNFLSGWLGEHCNIYDLEQVTIESLKKFIQYQQLNKRKASYINTQIKTFRSFFTYCKDEDYIVINVNKLRWAKQENNVISTFSPAQAKMMLSFYKNGDYCELKNKTIIMTLFETGIRCYELCCLQLEDIKSGYLLIHGKNHKERIVPLTPLLEKQLMRYVRVRTQYFDCKKYQSQFLFLSRTGRQLTNSAIENIVKNSGMSINDIRVSPHTCRHFYAQQQLKNGLDVYSLSRLLGHNNIAITQRYLQGLHDDDIIERAKTISVIQNL